MFDFDGTLVDTNALKHGTYATVLAGLGVPAALCLAVAEAYPARNRFDVIRAILQQWRGSPPAEHEVMQLAGEYGVICERGAIDAREMPGASAMLRTLSESFTLFLNSATPETSLRRVVDGRGWTGYFQAILGGPATKVENLRNILSVHSIASGEIVMVGDGLPDQDAARAVGCRFIAVGGFPPADAAAGEYLSDLRALPEALVRQPTRAAADRR